MKTWVRAYGKHGGTSDLLLRKAAFQSRNPLEDRMCDSLASEEKHPAKSGGAVNLEIRTTVRERGYDITNNTIHVAFAPFELYTWLHHSYKSHLDQVRKVVVGGVHLQDSSTLSHSLFHVPRHMAQFNRLAVKGWSYNSRSVCDSNQSRLASD